MRDAQRARTQAFRTKGGWFAYDLAANLAQIEQGQRQPSLGNKAGRDCDGSPDTNCPPISTAAVSH